MSTISVQNDKKCKDTRSQKHAYTCKKEDNDGIKIHSNHRFKRAFASTLVSCENLGIVGLIDEAQQIRSLSVLLKNFVRQC